MPAFIFSCRIRKRKGKCKKKDISQKMEQKTKKYMWFYCNEYISIEKIEKEKKSIV